MNPTPVPTFLRRLIVHGRHGRTLGSLSPHLFPFTTLSRGEADCVAPPSPFSGLLRLCPRTLKASKDVMESNIIRIAATPTRARSLEPGSAYGDSMDDLDSSTTRKRPRLDSGDRVYRSMSADRLRSSSPPRPHNHAHPEHNTSSSQTVSAPPPGQRSLDMTAPPMSSPSKVTINVREPPPIPSGESAQSSEDAVVSVTMRGGFATAERSPHHPHTPSAAASARSSPSGSPEIEVAEVEDMDGESGPTRWRALGTSTLVSARRVQENLLLQFPMLERFNTLTKVLEALENHFEKSIPITQWEDPCKS